MSAGFADLYTLVEVEEAVGRASLDADLARDASDCSEGDGEVEVEVVGDGDGLQLGHSGSAPGDGGLGLSQLATTTRDLDLGLDGVVEGTGRPDGNGRTRTRSAVGRDTGRSSAEIQDAVLLIQEAIDLHSARGRRVHTKSWRYPGLCAANINVHALVGHYDLEAPAASVRQHARCALLELLLDRVIHLCESCLHRTHPEAAMNPGGHAVPLRARDGGSLLAVMALVRRTRTLHDELANSHLCLGDEQELVGRLEEAVAAREAQIASLEATIRLFDHKTGRRIRDGAASDAGSLEQRRLEWQKLFDQMRAHHGVQKPAVVVRTAVTQTDGAQRIPFCETCAELSERLRQADAEGAELFGLCSIGTPASHVSDGTPFACSEATLAWASGLGVAIAGLRDSVRGLVADNKRIKADSEAALAIADETRRNLESITQALEERLTAEHTAEIQRLEGRAAAADRAHGKAVEALKAKAAAKDSAHTAAIQEQERAHRAALQDASNRAAATEAEHQAAMQDCRREHSAAIDQLRREAGKTAAAHAAMLETERAARRRVANELAGCSASCAKLEAQLATTTAAAASAAAQAEAELTAASEASAALEARLLAAQDRLNEDAAASAASLASQTSREEQLQQGQVTLEARLLLRDQDISRLEAAAEDTRAETLALADKVTAALADNALLQGQLSDLGADRAELDGKVGALEAENHELDGAVQAKGEEIARLQQGHAELCLDRTALQTRQAELEDQLAAVTAELRAALGRGPREPPPRIEAPCTCAPSSTEQAPQAPQSPHRRGLNPYPLHRPTRMWQAEALQPKPPPSPALSHKLLNRLSTASSLVAPEPLRATRIDPQELSQPQVRRQAIRQYLALRDQHGA